MSSWVEAKAVRKDDRNTIIRHLEDKVYYSLVGGLREAKLSDNGKPLTDHKWKQM